MYNFDAILVGIFKVVMIASKREKCICHARESKGKRESIKVQKHPPL